MCLLVCRVWVCVWVCVFVKLHITAQSGPVILVILCHSFWSSQGGGQCVCVCVCVCVFIKLHITAQSGPVIYSFYATGCNPPGGYLSCVFIKLHITTQSGPVILVILFVCVCVCVCVFIQFILDVRVVDVPAGVTQNFLRLPSAVLALIFLARRIQPSLSLVDREVKFCVPTNQSLSACWASFFLFYIPGIYCCEEKSQFVWLHRDSNSRPKQRQKVSRVTNWTTGATGCL